MKKNFIKLRASQQKLSPFQKSPIYDIKFQLKPEQNKLKKIGRNKLQFKESILPKLNVVKNKQNCAPNLQSSAQTSQLNQKQNQSFVKLEHIYSEPKLNQMPHSEKLNNEAQSQSRSKELLIKKQFLIRDKRMLMQRNCMSADIKKQNREPLPPSVKNIRQKLSRKISQAYLQSQNQKSLKLSEQAKQIALQVCPMTCPNSSKSCMKSPSLQDFLNTWITKPS